MKFIHKMLSKPLAADIVVTDIAEYQCLLLQSQAQAAYYAKMVEYYSEGIDRLAGFKPRSYSNGVTQ